MSNPLGMPQHERLTRILNIYRAAMRRHIAAQWRDKHGDTWFDDLYEHLPKARRQEIDATRNSLEARRVDGDLTESKDEEREFLLDIPVFMYAVRNRSDLFGKLADMERTEQMKAVYHLRNRWAHPPLRDLRQVEVDDVAARCAEVLALIDPDAAAELHGIGNGLADQTARPEAATLSEIRDNVLHMIDHPPAEVQAIAEIVVALQAEVGGIRDGAQQAQAEMERQRQRDVEENQARLTALEENLDRAVRRRLEIGLAALEAQDQQRREQVADLQRDLHTLIATIGARSQIGIWYHTKERELLDLIARARNNGAGR